MSSSARASRAEAEDIITYDSEFSGALHDIDDNLSTFSAHFPPKAEEQSRKSRQGSFPVPRKKLRPNPQSGGPRKPVSFKDTTLPILFLSAINSADLEILCKMISTHFAPDCQFTIRHDYGYCVTLEGAHLLVKYWYGVMNISPDAIFAKKEARFPLPRKDKVEFAFDVTVTKIYVPNVLQELVSFLLKGSSGSDQSNSSSSSNSNPKPAIDLLDKGFQDSVVSSIEELRSQFPSLEHPFLLTFSGTMTMFVDEEQKVVQLEMDTHSVKKH